MSTPVDTQALVEWINEQLQPQLFKDYSPNGIQVQGSPTISRMVIGVTASRALIDAAIERGADAIMVHHGYFWKNEEPALMGMKYERIQRLIKHNINLIAYHLPLDAHPAYGNNAMLAKALGLSSGQAGYCEGDLLVSACAPGITDDAQYEAAVQLAQQNSKAVSTYKKRNAGVFSVGAAGVVFFDDEDEDDEEDWPQPELLADEPLVWVGRSHVAKTVGQLAKLVARQLGREPLVIGDPNQPLNKVCWCSGGAQGFFESAIDAGADCYITGEASEYCFHEALESGAAFIAAGHHATEVLGIQALGSAVATEFEIPVEYIELGNPI